MTLLQQVKKQMMAALKAGNIVEKEILRVAIGEAETMAARVESFDDEATRGVLRKLVKSNEETLSLETDAAKRATLEEENAVLKALLPVTLSVESIIEILTPVRDAIRAASNDGQATGIAMKRLKLEGANAGGKDVASAVKQLRAAEA